MEELTKLIEKEEEIFKQREYIYLQVDTKYKCVWRLKSIHLAKDMQKTLHQLYDVEKKIEERMEFLLNKYKNEPDLILQLVNIFKKRLNSVISFLEKEKIHWQKICENIQKELNDNIKEYKDQLAFFKIKEFNIERSILKTY